MLDACSTLLPVNLPKSLNTMLLLKPYAGSTRLKAGFWPREVGIRLWRYVFVYGGDWTFISALIFSWIWILIAECCCFAVYLVLGSANAKPCLDGSIAGEVLHDGCRVPAYGCWNCREAYPDFQSHRPNEASSSTCNHYFGETVMYKTDDRIHYYCCLSLDCFVAVEMANSCGHMLPVCRWIRDWKYWRSRCYSVSI